MFGIKADRKLNCTHGRSASEIRIRKHISLTFSTHNIHFSKPYSLIWRPLTVKRSWNEAVSDRSLTYTSLENWPDISRATAKWWVTQEWMSWQIQWHSTKIIASHPPHKRRVWGEGNTSPLKTTAWEARKITDKEISGKSHLARSRKHFLTVARYLILQIIVDAKFCRFFLASNLFPNVKPASEWATQLLL